MTRLALAAIAFPESPEASVRAVRATAHEAAAAGADLVCFPECFVPGYRALGAPVPEVDADWLEQAHADVARAAADASVALVVGTERFVGGARRISALVVAADGRRLGWQDKVQLDPSEDGLYEAGEGRSTFEVAGTTLAVVICHEGWRYPEAVRAAALAGARLVVHPQFSPGDGPADRTAPDRAFADPAGDFHEGAARCRAAENALWFATVNCAAPGAPTGSAIVAPDGSVVCTAPRDRPGLLLHDVDPAAATGVFARRLRAVGPTTA